MKGRAAVLRDYGGEFELREYPVPDAEPGAILVRLTRAGICGSDLHIWRGEMKDVGGRRAWWPAPTTRPGRWPWPSCAET